jgi:hypothetical protein
LWGGIWGSLEIQKSYKAVSRAYWEIVGSSEDQNTYRTADGGGKVHEVSDGNKNSLRN